MSTAPTIPKKRMSRKNSISDQVENINIPLFSPTIQANGFSRLGVDNIKDNQRHITDINNDAIDKEEDDMYETQEEGTHNESVLKKIENLTSIFLIILEHIITSITFLLPNVFIKLCTKMSRFLFALFKSKNEKYNDFISNSEDDNSNDVLLKRIEKLKNFESFLEICELNGFKAESHIIRTADEFNLTLHRINPELNGFQSNGEAVYFQHGLLMSSDVWCVMLNKDDNLPFRLCELGYDVFLGNNRGNKYSNKHVKYSASDPEFWNFSIDEFAMYDIPSSINYILKLKNISKINYIGFSQGCSQMLSSVSINNDLNDKIEKLILIAPATTPKKLSNWLINSIVHFDPQVMYLLFGRKILMKSVLFWRRITYPPMFVKLIDIPNDILFNWKSKNIDILQKLVSYYHLYSTTSVKCIVHWFQIIRSKKFQMYQDKDYFQPFEYPTDKTIKIKNILIIYGMSDSLVDIDILVGQLPQFKKLSFNQIKDSKIIGKRQVINDEKSNCVDNSELRIFGINNYEHLDLLWGKNMNENVINNVIKFLK